MARSNSSPLSGAGPSPISFLNSAGNSGSAKDLFIASRPPGAKVFMDGKPAGTTPVTLRAVPIGSHAIRLEHDGYRRWSSAVRVVASQQNRITASLEK